MSVVQFTKAFLIAARNCLISGNLVSLSLLAKPSAMVGYANESLFLFRTLTDRRGLPQKNVFEIFPQARVAGVQFFNAGEFPWFSSMSSFTADIVSLGLLCQAIQPKVVFEIGTLTGYTAAHMALNTPDDCKIYTLDLPPDVSPALPTTVTDSSHVGMHAQRKRYVWDDAQVAHKIQTLSGDSAKFDYSPYLGRVDLFFIDGAHSYEYVRSDTLHALTCCHPGSTLVWHDFGRVGVNGVSRWLVEFSRQHAVYSIPGGSLAFCVLDASPAPIA